MKNLHQIDLNLLVYLEVLLRERNVTQAANQLGLSQPAMSNGLRRLRALFDDPLLVRTSEGMNPTERALELEPLVKEILLGVDLAMQPASEFAPGEAVLKRRRCHQSRADDLQCQRGKRGRLRRHRHQW